MASPSKIQRLDTFLTDFTEEVDTELKAVCYDISNKNKGQAIKAVEKIRRKLKAMEGKVKTIIKLNEIENSKLSKENLEMKKEVENLKKKIENLEEDDFFLSSQDCSDVSSKDAKSSPNPKSGSSKDK